MAPAERFLAPFAVLALHIGLLVDVVAYNYDLLHLRGIRQVAEWVIAAIAILSYLRTVICDPGFLRPSGSRPSPCSCFIAWLPASIVLCGAALCRHMFGGRFGSKPESASGTTATRDIRLRDLKSAHENELQPIGRSVFDAIAGEEAGSDPGEEEIDLKDLEIGTQSTVALSEQPSSTSSSSVKVQDRSLELPSNVASPHRQSGIRQGSPFKRKEAGKGFGRESCPDTWHLQEDSHVSGQPVTQSGHKLRFCKECSMYQPLRTKHCRDCGHCVRTHDHHCPWVGTCIGEGNRHYFYWFLIAQWMELAVFFLEGIFQLFQVGFDLQELVAFYPLLCVGLFVMALLLFMVTCLLCFHTYLALTNLTTWESISWHNISYLRTLDPSHGSPFSHSLRLNLATYCCLPLCPSRGCCWSGPSPVKLNEDGWAMWDLGEQHSPEELEYCGGECCSCFDVSE